MWANTSSYCIASDLMDQTNSMTEIVFKDNFLTAGF